MRIAKVFIHNILAGILLEDDEGYHFTYEESYLESSSPEAVSLTLPVKKTVHHNNVLFPFFDGLIPEGWLLSIAEKNWKLDNRDRMGILLETCEDCIGAVSIRK